MRDTRDPQEIGNAILALRREGVPILVAADAVTGLPRPVRYTCSNEAESDGSLRLDGRGPGDPPPQNGAHGR